MTDSPERYRAEAATLRHLAETNFSPEMKGRLFALARDYDLLADQAEQNAADMKADAASPGEKSARRKR
jgi:hypothetical protein